MVLVSTSCVSVRIETTFDKAQDACHCKGENKVDNSDDYIDDDYAYYDEEYDNEYDSDDYPETEGYELNHNDKLEFEGDEEWN